MNLNIYNMNRGQLTLLGSTICVILSVLLSIKLLLAHLSNWKKPKEQKAIVVIILMAPIYAVSSYFGLLDFRGSEAFFMLLDSIKECYEALVSVYCMFPKTFYSNITICTCRKDYRVIHVSPSNMVPLGEYCLDSFEYKFWF